MRLALLLGITLWAQNIQPHKTAPTQPADTTEFVTNTPANTPTSADGAEYLIGRDDLLDVSVFDVPELGSSGRVNASGSVSFPLIGVVQAAGKTTQDLEKIIEATLKEKYLNNPHVTVFVREYASQPVSVMGAVKTPGIYQIKGQKSLLDMIAMAQGIDPMTAGKTIQIIRRNNAATAEDAKASSKTIAVDIEELFENGKTELNVPIAAGDVINVARAGSVFVVGEVVHPNEFVLRNGKNVTVTQAVALANGTTKDAKKKDCMIIRYHRDPVKGDTTKEEIAVDYDKVLRGSATDVTMLPNDILFVPANKIKAGLNRALESTISVAMGRLIYVGF